MEGPAGHREVQSHSTSWSRLPLFVARSSDETEPGRPHPRRRRSLFQTGNICFPGYHKDPAATAKLFRGGVLYSGDLAGQHPDGSVQILDHKKDFIVSGGEDVSSVALETALTRHPAILEVAYDVVTHAIYDEVPKAYVTLRSRQPLLLPPLPS
jgi:acyl-CoA synthetase (AMP-forming)/AMP-acid ligase II